MFLRQGPPNTLLQSPEELLRHVCDELFYDNYGKAVLIRTHEKDLRSGKFFFIVRFKFTPVV